MEGRKGRWFLGAIFSVYWCGRFVLDEAILDEGSHRLGIALVGNRLCRVYDLDDMEGQKERSWLALSAFAA